MESSIRISNSGVIGEQVCWRPWPCSECAAGATPVSFIAASHRANPEISNHANALPVNEGIEYLVCFERDRLLSWCAECRHSGDLRRDSFFRINQGSEHIVYKDTDGAVTEIVKVTHPGLYGEHYAVDEGRIWQFACTPGQYLKRMKLLDFFGLPTTPVGITDSGQILSRQKFILGEPPSQSEVNGFMSEAGMIPVKIECFLWKTQIEDDLEIWVGDVRDENFVKTPEGIIPIDIRMWAKIAAPR
jgi:hypothetical protein